MENKQVSGEVQAIRKDKKALQILGNWYQSNFKVLDDLNKGDWIILDFTEKGEFRNVKSYKTMPKIKPIDSNNVKEVPTQTINTLVMCVKDLMVAVLNNAENIKDKRLLLEIYDELNKLVIESYRRIKSEI